MKKEEKNAFSLSYIRKYNMVVFNKESKSIFYDIGNTLWMVFFMGDCCHVSIRGFGNVRTF